MENKSLGKCDNCGGDRDVGLHPASGILICKDCDNGRKPTTTEMIEGEIEPEIAIELECVPDDELAGARNCTGVNGHCPIHCNNRDKVIVFITKSQLDKADLIPRKDAVKYVEIDIDKVSKIINDYSDQLFINIPPKHIVNIIGIIKELNPLKLKQQGE